MLFVKRNNEKQVLKLLMHHIRSKIMMEYNTCGHRWARGLPLGGWVNFLLGWVQVWFFYNFYRVGSSLGFFPLALMGVRLLIQAPATSFTYRVSPYRCKIVKGCYRTVVAIRTWTF